MPAQWVRRDRHFWTYLSLFGLSRLLTAGKRRETT